jgi:hypothetical protein
MLGLLVGAVLLNEIFDGDIFGEGMDLGMDLLQTDDNPFGFEEDNNETRTNNIYEEDN